MPLKRLLVLGLLVALALRLLPVLGPIVWPGYRKSIRALQRRADLATGAVMLALCTSLFVQRQPWVGVMVAVLAIPAWVAAVKALRGP